MPKLELPGLYGTINRGDTQNTLKKNLYKIQMRANDIYYKNWNKKFILFFNQESRTLTEKQKDKGKSQREIEITYF
jgi:hypothetical protein